MLWFVSRKRIHQWPVILSTLPMMLEEGRQLFELHASSFLFYMVYASFVIPTMNNGNYQLSSIDNLFDNSRYLFVSVSDWRSLKWQKTKNWKITSMLLILADGKQLTLSSLLLPKQNKASSASLATKTLPSCHRVFQ